MSDLGFRVRRVSATGAGSDTTHLRAGSIVQHSDTVAVYLGRPNGKDSWLVDDRVQDAFAPATGDRIIKVEPDVDFHPVDEPRPRWFRGLFERVRDELFAVFVMSTFINLVALAVSLYTMLVYSVVIPSGAASSVWWVALFALIAILGGWALKIGRQVVMSRLSGWVGIRIGEAAMRKMLSFPLDMSAKFGAEQRHPHAQLRKRAAIPQRCRRFLSGRLSVLSRSSCSQSH